MAELAESKPVLHYWGVKSRTHAINYLLGYNGLANQVTLKQDIGYPGTPEFAQNPSSKLGQLPFLQDGEVQLGQSGAIFAYLAKKFNIGQDLSLADYAKSEELIAQAADVFAILAKAHYGEDRTAAMDAAFAGQIAKTLTAFEPCVTDSGFFCTTASPGDLAFASVLNLLTCLEPGVLTSFPKLAAFDALIQANEGIQAANAVSPYMYFKRKSDE